VKKTSCLRVKRDVPHQTACSGDENAGWFGVRRSGSGFFGFFSPSQL
jgi:hypothetical protein